MYLLFCLLFYWLSFPTVWLYFSVLIFFWSIEMFCLNVINFSNFITDKESWIMDSLFVILNNYWLLNSVTFCTVLVIFMCFYTNASSKCQIFLLHCHFFKVLKNIFENFMYKIVIWSFTTIISLKLLLTLFFFFNPLNPVPGVHICKSIQQSTGEWVVYQCPYPQ